MICALTEIGSCLVVKNAAGTPDVYTVWFGSKPLLALLGMRSASYAQVKIAWISPRGIYHTGQLSRMSQPAALTVRPAQSADAGAAGYKQVKRLG